MTDQKSPLKTPISKEARFHLLIPAAGTASRMGMDLPKPYLQINGKTILRHTIDKFININGLQSVSVVVNEAHMALCHDAVKELENVNIVTGCKSRKLSVNKGLKAIPNVKSEDIILVHDAARPMVQRDDIEAILRIMQNAPDIEAASLATRITDTIIGSDMPIDRHNVWAIQTPQAFKYGLLKAAHEKFKDDDSFTDDAGIMRDAGHKVEIVPSSKKNIKITTPEDLETIEMLMNCNMTTRTASGYDVHAFEDTPSERKFIMGGIQIDHPLALTGHSDADVVLHAITDALLGAINEGDIGTHFPPSDPQWKDVDSAVFLAHAGKMLSDIDGVIDFIDVTIMAEAPKIGPHRTAMQDRIAEILSLPTSKVSIKATTTEKLGFTGREEGIACQALATIRLPVSE